MKINKKQDTEDIFNPISLEEFNLVEDWLVDPTLNVEELNEQDLREESHELGLQLRSEGDNKRFCNHLILISILLYDIMNWF